MLGALGALGGILLKGGTGLLKGGAMVARTGTRIGVRGGRSLLRGAVRGARSGGIGGGIRRGRGKVSKEPIWSSGTTESGEYLSSGDRKAIFRKSRMNIGTGGALVPFKTSELKISADSSPFVSKEPDIEDSSDLVGNKDDLQDNRLKKLEKRVTTIEKKIGIKDDTLSPIKKSGPKIGADVDSSVPFKKSESKIGADSSPFIPQELEKRVTNNEKKISTIKRILEIRKNDQSLAEVSSILQDIGNALSLDFANRISQEKADISSMREGTDSNRRTKAESSIESVKKISSTVGKAFDKVTKPVQGIFSRIFGFFGALIKGWIANKALKWMSNNAGKVQGLFNFLEKHGSKLIVPGLLGMMFGPQLLIGKAAGALLPKKPSALGGLSKKAKIKVNNSMRRYIRRHGIKKAQQRFGKDAVKGLGGKFARGGVKNLTRKAVTGVLGKGGTKQLLKFAKKFISPVVKKIPLIGALIDFALNVFVFKEPIGKAAFKAIGAGLGLWLGGLIGTLIPIPFVGTALGGWLGGVGGDMLGGAIYDMIFGNKPTDKGGENDAKIEKVVSEYTDVATTASKMDFSKNVQSTDLTPPEEGDMTTVMDTVKLGDRADAAANGGNMSGDSTPLVGSEDLSNTYTTFTTEQLGITE